MAIAAAAISVKVAHTKIFDNTPLLYCPMIFSLRAILAIMNMSGTAATPLNTAVKTRALIGSIPIKLMVSPMSVAMVIIP